MADWMHFIGFNNTQQARGPSLPWASGPALGTQHPAFDLRQSYLDPPIVVPALLIQPLPPPIIVIDSSLFRVPGPDPTQFFSPQPTPPSALPFPAFTNPAPAADSSSSNNNNAALANLPGTLASGLSFAPGTASLGLVPDIQSATTSDLPAQVNSLLAAASGGGSAPTPGADTVSNHIIQQTQAALDPAALFGAAGGTTAASPAPGLDPTATSSTIQPNPVDLQALVGGLGAPAAAATTPPGTAASPSAPLNEAQVLDILSDPSGMKMTAFMNQNADPFIQQGVQDVPGFIANFSRNEVGRAGHFFAEAINFGKTGIASNSFAMDVNSVGAALGGGARTAGVGAAVPPPPAAEGAAPAAPASPPAPAVEAPPPPEAPASNSPSAPPEPAASSDSGENKSAPPRLFRGSGARLSDK